MLWRRHPESDRGMKVLQTSALPLGYGAEFHIRQVYGKRDYVIHICLSLLERVTRFELATSTLARWRSTK